MGERRTQKKASSGKVFECFKLNFELVERWESKPFLLALLAPAPDPAKQINKSCIKCKKFPKLSPRESFYSTRKQKKTKKSIPQSFCTMEMEMAGGRGRGRPNNRIVIVLLYVKTFRLERSVGGERTSIDIKVSSLSP